MGRSQIEKKIIALVKDFSNKVYLKVIKRKSRKKTGTPIETVSMHVAISKWRAINDRLLDIGINTDTVTGRDRIFYLDQ